MIKNLNFNGKVYIVETDGGNFEIKHNDVFKNILNSNLVNYITISELHKYFGIHQISKDILLKKINLYHNSDTINSFKYKGKEYWLDKTQRTSLSNLITNYPESSIEIILGSDIYTFTISTLKNLLTKLEQYAYKCKIATQKHLNIVSAVKIPSSKEGIKEFIEFLESYDYTTGYPDKVILEDD